MAINRQAIVERVMEGNAVVASQFLPPGGAGTSPNVKPTPYDPAKAKALLAEAGYPNGFRLTVHGPNDRIVNDAKIVQVLAQMFARIGVETKVEVMPWSVYSTKSTGARIRSGAGFLGRQHRRNLEPAAGADRDLQSECGDRRQQFRALFQSRRSTPSSRPP